MDELDATDLWSRAFGHFFPMPDVSTASDVRLSKANALVPVSDPDVEVSAIARNNSAIRYKGVNSLATPPCIASAHRRSKASSSVVAACFESGPRLAMSIPI